MAEPAEKIPEESGSDASPPSTQEAEGRKAEGPTEGQIDFAEFDKELDDFDQDSDDDAIATPPAAEETPPPPAADAPASPSPPADEELHAGKTAEGKAPSGEEPPAEETTPASAEGEKEGTAPSLESLPPEAKKGEEAPAAEPTPSDEERKTAYEEARTAAISQLEAAYAFSEEDAEALNAEPEKVLPKVAAKLHMEVLQNVLQTVQANLPAWVQGVQQATARQEQFSQQFFKQWPDLREHVSEVDRIGQVWRTMNPNAPVDDYIREVGAMAMVRLRKPIPGATQGDSGESGGAQAPSASAPLAPSASKAPSPPRTAAPDKPLNIFEEIDKAFDDSFEEEEI